MTVSRLVMTDDHVFCIVIRLGELFDRASAPDA